MFGANTMCSFISWISPISVFQRYADEGILVMEEQLLSRDQLNLINNVVEDVIYRNFDIKIRTEINISR